MMNPYNNTPINYNTEHNLMTLNGKGSVTAVPDIAVLRLGVQTTGENLTSIQEDNARLSQAVLQALRQLGVSDIKTFQYEINKLIDYVDGNRVDRGYTVRNILEIRTNEIDRVGEIIDTAVNYGANVVELIDFEVSDTDAYYLEALNLAVLNAYQKAKSISQSLGILMDPVPRRITENSTLPIPMRNTFLREGAFATPIEAGNKVIEALVTVEFRY